MNVSFFHFDVLMVLTSKRSSRGVRRGKMTMGISRVLSDTPPESERPKSAWCCFLIAHLDYFANLVWYLVVDPVLLECVMIRALELLESMPLDASETQLTFTQARRALIGEAIIVLSPLRGSVATRRSEKLYDLPDFQRLAFLLKQDPKSRFHPLLPETQIQSR
jgi:hypothetical protein